MPCHAEMHDNSATEPNHWGGEMHKQEEAVKKKSFNCGLERTSTSHEIYSRQLNVCASGSRGDATRSSLGHACSGVS